MVATRKRRKAAVPTPPPPPVEHKTPKGRTVELHAERWMNGRYGSPFTHDGVEFGYLRRFVGQIMHGWRGPNPKEIPDTFFGVFGEAGTRTHGSRDNAIAESLAMLDGLIELREREAKEEAERKQRLGDLLAGLAEATPPQWAAVVSYVIEHEEEEGLLSELVKFNEGMAAKAHANADYASMNRHAARAAFYAECRRKAEEL